MATLILLNKTELPKGTPSEALVAVWDKGSVPDGQISIPVELNERLLPIRDDLAAWTYETGCARINGKLLEEHLRADDNLSMWWCSTLVEKHPKVTHNLFPALKLRALELLLDEKGVTRLELCAAAGADPWMEDVLGRFCKATGREFAVRRIGSAEAAQPEGLKAKLKACYYRLPAPVNEEVRRKVIGNAKVITHRPADDIAPELEKYRKEIGQYITQEEDVLTYALFPQVATKFFEYRQAQQLKLDNSLLDKENHVLPV